VNENPLTFFIPGAPKGRAHTRPQAVRGRRGYTGKVVSVPEKSDAKAIWFMAVQHHARRAVARQGWVLVESGNLLLEVEFILPRPVWVDVARKRWSKAHGGQVPPYLRVWKGVDQGNLVKALEDLLTGIVWRDDAQVDTRALPRRYAREGEDPGALVTVADKGEWDTGFQFGVEDRRELAARLRADGEDSERSEVR
jgi:Holliday junction resolvase RusA-like endonuclease